MVIYTAHICRLHSHDSLCGELRFMHFFHKTDNDPSKPTY